MQCENSNDTAHEIREGNKVIGGKWLSFWLDGQLFGVSIAGVQQIVGMQPIAEMPDYPAYAKGVINLRGAIIPVIDLRKRLGKTEIAYTDHTCIIISSLGVEQLGFIVDEVDSVIDISQNEIAPPPKMGGDTTNCYLTGVARITDNDGAESIILCLNVEKVLRQEELNVLQDTLQ